MCSRTGQEEWQKERSLVQRNQLKAGFKHKSMTGRQDVCIWFLLVFFSFNHVAHKVVNY